MASRTTTLKKLNVPPPPLHEKLSLEGRWRTVRLLQSLQPTQNPILLEKHLFVQCQGDVQLYESGIYRVCAAIHLKREKVSAYSPEKLVVKGGSRKDNSKAKVVDVKAVVTMPAPKTVECQIKCGRCKSTQVSVEQKQTRGADESMTVFVQCEKCGLRWKM
jgi:DNA-directed RNA polymerase subunit M/transcription elongation factor TFIIS